MATEVTASALFAGPDRGTLENVILRHDNGLITSIDPAAAPPPSPRTFIIPAFVNAHDHARPTASSFGAVDMPLESWIIRVRVRHAARSLSRRGVRAWRVRRARAAAR